MAIIMINKIERIDGIGKIESVRDDIRIKNIRNNKSVIAEIVSHALSLLNSWRLIIFPSSIIIFSFLPPREYFTWVNKYSRFFIREVNKYFPKVS